MAKTLYEKLFDAHVVFEAQNETPLLYIDRHLVHEVTSPQAFDGLRAHGRQVRQPGKTFATMDHNVSTQTKDINASGEMARIQMQELIKNCNEFGVELYDLNQIPTPLHTARSAHWHLALAPLKLNTFWRRRP